MVVSAPLGTEGELVETAAPKPLSVRPGRYRNPFESRIVRSVAPSASMSASDTPPAFSVTEGLAAPPQSLPAVHLTPSELTYDRYAPACPSRKSGNPSPLRS